MLWWTWTAKSRPLVAALDQRLGELGTNEPGHAGDDDVPTRRRRAHPVL
jgi:hypothetical protein